MQPNNKKQLLPEEITALLKKSPGMTDREITSHLRKAGSPQQPINIAARALESRGILIRRKRNDGLIGNYLSVSQDIGPASRVAKPIERVPEQFENSMSEDEAKQHLSNWLEGQGWTTRIAWAKTHGIDIEAARGPERWIIEVKGTGSRPEMRVNYFIGILGETLQRMHDPQARYSIAFPDVKQFRNLWTRLPSLAKQRTGITMLFVSKDGEIEELSD